MLASRTSYLFGFRKQIGRPAPLRQLDASENPGVLRGPVIRRISSNGGRGGEAAWILGRRGAFGGDFGGRRSAGDAGGGGGFQAVPADPRAGRREAAGARRAAARPWTSCRSSRCSCFRGLRGLSLAATEAMVRDRPGWMRFCGIELRDKVPGREHAVGLPARRRA